MVWTVERAEACDRDLSLIFDFLVESHIGFGDDVGTAFDRAAVRIRSIEDAIDRLADAPYQGTLRPDLLPGLRSVTKDRAILYFDIDEDRRIVQLLAIFFGGQDHGQSIVTRLG